MLNKLFSVVLIGALCANPAIGGAAKCAQNECLDRVKHGHKPGGFGACNAFLRVTVIPKTTKTTVTTVATVVKSATVSETSTISTISVTKITRTETEIATTLAPLSLHKRAATNKPTTISQTTVPRYASAQCANVAQYSSACSCVGVTQSTTTLPSPVSTVSRTSKTREFSTTTQSFTETTYTTTLKDVSSETTTIVSTATDSSTTKFPVACASPQPTFVLEATTAQDPGIQGKYAILDGEQLEGVAFTPSSSAATRFTRRQDCALVTIGSGKISTTHPYQDSSFFLFATQAQTDDYELDVFVAGFDDNDALYVYSPTANKDKRVLQVVYNTFLGVGRDVGPEETTLTLTREIVG